MTLNLAPIVTVLLGAAGSVVILYLAFQLLGHWPARRYGSMITEFVIACVVGYVCFFPDSAKTTISALGKTVFG